MNIKKAKKKALKEINGLFEAVDKLEGNKSENLKKEKRLTNHFPLLLLALKRGTAQLLMILIEIY